MKISRLKQIIKEEVQTIINEATRWGVGIEDRNGKILSTYGHWDGYPDYTGKMLKRMITHFSMLNKKYPEGM
jgi:hypothetical protein